MTGWEYMDILIQRAAISPKQCDDLYYEIEQHLAGDLQYDHMCVDAQRIVCEWEAYMEAIDKN